MISILFLLFLFVKSTDLKIIKQDFYYCNKTNEILNINVSCVNQWDCINFNNIINILKENSDKFSFLSLINETQVVFINHEFYRTRCSNIKQIELVEKVDRCTNDLFVKFTHNNFQKVGFLTKERIIRNSSFFISCNTKRKFFTSLGTNMHIYTENKLIKIDTVNVKTLDLFFDKKYENQDENFYIGDKNYKNDI